MSKKNKALGMLREFPQDDLYPITSDELLSPLKKILVEGYKWERLPKNDFIYIGFNLGKTEQFYYPTPKERFCHRWLNNESKFARSLIDNVLLVAYQFGMEQGRREIRPQLSDQYLMENIIWHQTDRIRSLEQRLGEYDPRFNGLIPSQLVKGQESLVIDGDDPEEIEGEPEVDNIVDVQS